MGGHGRYLPASIMRELLVDKLGRFFFDEAQMKETACPPYFCGTYLTNPNAHFSVLFAPCPQHFHRPVTNRQPLRLTVACEQTYLDTHTVCVCVCETLLFRNGVGSDAGSDA